MVFKGRGLTKKHFNKKANYIIDEFLVQGAITMIYAPPKNGKSSFAIGLCKWLMDNTDVYPCYLDYDNPTIALEDRKVNNIIEEYNTQFDYVHPDVIRMSAKDAINEMLNDVKNTSYSNVVLFFDSATNFISDVGSDTAVSAFIEKMKILRSAGATIIILHHTNKSEAGYKGSGNFSSQCDNVFSLTSEDINELEGNILLERKDARFGRVKSVAFNLRKDNWEMKKVKYEDVNMPIYVQNYIREITRVLRKAKEPLNQTKLLEALGKNKADKTLLEILIKYTGVYWSFSEKGKAKLYSIL
jgi:RecA-family ATPase